MPPSSSEKFRTLKVMEKLQVGDAALSTNAYGLRLTMLARTTTTLHRDRYAAVFDPVVTPNKPWTVPYGLTVKGITLKPRNQASLDALRALPTSVQSADTNANGTPCGEMGLTIHRISIADNPQTNSACNPIGTYVASGTTAYNAESTYTAPSLQYSDANTDQYSSYFKHFVANCNGATADSAFIGSVAPWNNIRYRQANDDVRYVAQPGAPVVYNDASRSLFANVGLNTAVYIPIEGNLVSDGTWGIAVGFVSQASYVVGVGATEWPAIDLDIVVHTEQVSL